MKLKDRSGRPFALGGTHEEVITDLVATSVRSYRELPFTLYQLQTKFRDDPRPRGGLVRVREFVMKDAYSFDRDIPGLDRSYDLMVAAYHKILQRLGLPYHVVLASGGGIGGWDTREFEMPTEVGESHYLLCEACGMTATPEVAELAEVAETGTVEEMLPLERVDTPGQKTIEQVTAFLKLPPQKLVKTLIYTIGDRVVAALVRGDRELSEDKLKAALGVRKLKMADEDVIRRVTGAPVGFAGPVGITGAEIIADLGAQRPAQLRDRRERRRPSPAQCELGPGFPGRCVGAVAPDRAGRSLPVRREVHRACAGSSWRTYSS